METNDRFQKLEDLKVWCKAKELGKHIYLVNASEPFCKDYPLRDQIRRAVISISSNIAEGFRRYCTGEFRNFLSIASGSTTEMKSQIYPAMETGFLDGKEAYRLIQLCDEITRMVAGFRRKGKK